MSSPATTPSPATSTVQPEAFQVLVDLARRKSASIPPELLANHVLAIAREGDWPVKRAAMDAILRRILVMQQEAIKLDERPPKGLVPGLYSTRVRARRRPYRTLLLSWDPIAGSCDCADYHKSSLGLCKHLLVIVNDWAHRQSRRKSRLAAVLPADWPAGRLTWDPIRPLTGPGDWLDRLRWAGPVLPRRLKPWHLGDGRLGAGASARPEARLELIRALGVFVASAPSAVVDPAIPPLVAADKERLQLRIDGAETARKLPALLHGLKHHLYPFQKTGVVRAVSAGRLLLADDMGLGKTIQAIATGHALWRARQVRRGLLVVPASLKSQWQREWNLFTDVPIRIVEGTAPERAAAYEATKEGFLIANYEQVTRDLDVIRGWDPQLVVLDEAQRIKNWETKTAAAVKELKPPLRLVLTGTPMENRLDELASIMDWVDEDALEPKWRLVPWHSQTADGSREVVGARNLTTLRERLDGKLLRRRRSEVLGELPSRTDTRVPIDLTPEQMAEHAELDRPIVRYIQIAKKRPLKQEEFLRLMTLLAQQRMICNGLALAQFTEVERSLEKRRPTETTLAGLFSPKLRELREIIANVVVSQEQKVVVFSQWRRMLVLAHWAVSDLLAKAKVKSVFFSGQESLKRRTQNIIDLHDDPHTRVLFSTDAGGVGLNLQRAATCCINLELPWNPAVLEQRIGRIHRNGQKRPVEVYNLICNAGIESRIADLVADKRALFGGLFDGVTDEIRFEGAGSFLTRVEKLVESKPADSGDVEEPVDVPEEEESEEEAEPEAREEAVPEPIAPEPPAPPTPVEPPRAPQAAVLDVRQMLAQVNVQVTADGGIAITAPRDAAASLASLFADLARKLAEASAPTSHSAPPP